LRAVLNRINDRFRLATRFDFSRESPQVPSSGCTVADTPPNSQFPALAAERVLFEDPHLLAVNKPAPLLTQAPPGVPNLEALVKAYIKAKYAKPAGVYLGVPHRLDRPVSGVIVFARNTKAAQRVHKQFELRTPTKTYWAVVSGLPAPADGVWDDWVRKVPGEARLERTAEGEPGAKRASVGYTVLATVPGGAVLELRPVTGRMHQLRAQCGWRGHPVLGDDAYGSGVAFGPPAELPRDRVIALHARRLVLEHPFTRQPLTLVAPVPEYWPAVAGGG
jgi:23S rRNA pseudouridine1911/1915/1917 synthase